MNNTKEKILTAAIDLFNESGSAKVSTNLICDRLSISPGNLYYHFRSKEEIIVTIFQRMIDQWDKSPLPGQPDLQNLSYMYERTIEYLWNYRFIHREINSLYHDIEKFKTIFDEVQARRLKEIRNFIKEYSKVGIFKVMSSKDIELLSRTIWFFSLYWMSYLETEGKTLNKETIKESVKILNNIIKPFINNEEKKNAI